MGSKRDAREARKALKQQQFEDAKQRLLEKVDDVEQPKVIVSVDDTKAPHIAPNVDQLSEKKPKAEKDGSRFGSLVSWCTIKADTEGKWSWHEPRQWTKGEWNTDILPPFSEFSQKTWAEIDEPSSGSGHKMHHDQEISSLRREARRRWKKLGLEEFDTAFRFRLGGTKRAWGYIVQSHFFFVWWERHHKIYPTDK